MKQKFWRNPSFKKLEQKWDMVLTKSGFCDVEKKVNGARCLKQRANNSYRSADSIRRELKQRYYELLGHGFHENVFIDPVHELIMERRSRGVKIKDICIELKKKKERNNRDTVGLIIRIYEAKWGIKKNN